MFTRSSIRRSGARSKPVKMSINHWHYVAPVASHVTCPVARPVASSLRRLAEKNISPIAEFRYNTMMLNVFEMLSLRDVVSFLLTSRQNQNLLHIDMFRKFFVTKCANATVDEIHNAQNILKLTCDHEFWDELCHVFAPKFETTVAREDNAQYLACKMGKEAHIDTVAPYRNISKNMCKWIMFHIPNQRVYAYDLPKHSDDYDYGLVKKGTKVFVINHRPIPMVDLAFATNWNRNMDEYTMKIATVTKLSGADNALAIGIRIDIDKGLYFYRLRDTRIVQF